jgi:hypothetical protein
MGRSLWWNYKNSFLYNYTIHPDNWFTNGTFNYTDFNEDVLTAEESLHPAGDIDISGVKAATIFNAFVFVALMITYEILRRHFPYVYASKTEREERLNGANSEAQHSMNLPDILHSSRPLQWFMPVFGVSWKTVRREGGLDAYFYLRYIRMCLRITSVSAFWGMLVLFPVFATGGNGAIGWYHLSMANVPQGNPLGIWIPTLFLYLFTSFVLFVIKQEYKHYIDLRLDFLGKGDGSSDPQHHYSVMVENIPEELTSDRALFDYFETMFPGKIHSANVILNLKDIETLSAKKETVTRRLEKSIAWYHATGRRPTHVNGRPRLTLCGIELARPIDILFCCCEPNVALRDYDLNEEIPKGAKVDSIKYYTRDLMRLNALMHEEQKTKLGLAEFGNFTLQANTWFSRVNDVVQHIVDDPYQYDSDETSDDERGGEVSHQDNYRLDATVDDNSISYIDSQAEVISPDTISDHFGYGSFDEDDSPNRGTKARMKYFRKNKIGGKKNGSDSSKEEPLIDSARTDDSEETTPTKSKFKHRISSYYRKFHDSNTSTRTENILVSTGCVGNKKMAKDISRFAGIFGFDFFFYAMKLGHRVLYRALDTDDTDGMSKTGFVTFMDLGTVTCVASAPLTQKPKMLEVEVAPEARDIIWHNAHYTSDFCERRESNASIFLAAGAILWSIPLALIQGLASAENVAQLPGMDWILNQSRVYLFINSYLPVVALLVLIMILPLVLDMVATTYEKRKMRSDVEQCLVSRYFYYQLANIYISVTAGSLWKSAADIIARPSAVLEILGNSLPTVVGYFISLIITKILAGLPMVFLRFGALSRFLLLRLITRRNYLTQHELNSIYRVQPIYYGWEYPTQLLVIVICFTYACISPVILFFGMCYFAGALMVYKKQVLYVYTPAYESGGSLFPLVCDRTIIGLICGQLTFMGYSTIRGGHYQPICILPLVYFTVQMMYHFRVHYAEPSKRLTLERAMQLDEEFRTISSKGHRKNKKGPPQDNFSKDHYKQPVLTEKFGEPMFYRHGIEDELTLEARATLQKAFLNSSMKDENQIV